MRKVYLCRETAPPWIRWDESPSAFFIFSHLTVREEYEFRRDTWGGFVETRIISLDGKSSHGVSVGSGQPWVKKHLWFMHLERNFSPSCPAITMHHIFLMFLRLQDFWECNICRQNNSLLHSHSYHKKLNEKKAVVLTYHVGVPLG